MLYNRHTVGTEGGSADMEAATFFKLCWQYGVWIFGPMMVIGLCVLIFSIVKVIRVVRTSVVATLPLVDEQPFDFPQAGRYVLSDEGPLITFRFKGLRYELVGPDGTAVAARPTLFRAKTSGFTSSRVEVRVFTVTQPGRHVLRVEGLGDPQEADARHHFVFTKPHLFASLLCILGILAGAFMTIGGLVLFILRLLPEGAVQ